MNTNSETKQIARAKKLGVLGILLCGACCALPLLPFIGAGLAGTLAFWFEKTGLVLLVGSALFFIVYFIRRNSTKKACATDCECKEAPAAKN